MGELKKVFRPEFLNRIDEVIVFHKLTKEEIAEIVELLLKPDPGVAGGARAVAQPLRAMRRTSSSRRAGTRRWAPARCAGRSSATSRTRLRTRCSKSMEPGLDHRGRQGAGGRREGHDDHHRQAEGAHPRDGRRGSEGRRPRGGVLATGRRGRARVPGPSCWTIRRSCRTCRTLLRPPKRTSSLSAAAVDGLDLAGVGVDADHRERAEGARCLAGPRQGHDPEGLRRHALTEHPDLRALRREVDLLLRLGDRLILVEADRRLLAGLGGHEREQQHRDDHAHAQPLGPAGR